VFCHGEKCNYLRQDKDGYSPHIGEMRLARPSCRSVGSAGWYEVAGLVRPLAHCFNPAICSAIRVDSGTNSMRIRATSKSPGSRLLSKAKYKASVNILSISLPVDPSVALANCTRSKSGGLRPYCRIGMPQIASLSFWFGQAHKHRVASVTLCDGFAARRLGSATTKRSGDSNEIEPVKLL
jgi:hypothetical protein